MSKVLRVGAKGQVDFVSRRQAGELAEDLGTRVTVIQAIDPAGLGGRLRHVATGR